MLPKNVHLEKTFFWVMLSLLLIGFLWLMAPFYSPLIIALVLALTSDPLYQGILKLFGKRRHLGAIVCLLILFLFLAIPGGAVMTLTANQLLKLAQNFHFDPRFMEDLFGDGVIAQTFDHWREILGIEVNVGEWLKEFFHKSAQVLYQFSPKVVSKTANFFLSLIITIVLTYFFLVEGPRIYHEFLELSPLRESHEKTLAREIRVALRACIYGYIVTGLVQGILAAIGFAIVGVKIALLLGLATFFMSFIPFLGAASIWVSVLLYLVFSGHYGKAIFMGIYGGIIVSGIDNVLKPILIQGKTNIHPVLLFLAIFGGIKIWGPIGILAGPTLVAVFLAMLRIYRQDFR